MTDLEDILGDLGKAELKEDADEERQDDGSQGLQDLQEGDVDGHSA